MIQLIFFLNIQRYLRATVAYMRFRKCWKWKVLESSSFSSIAVIKNSEQKQLREGKGLFQLPSYSLSLKEGRTGAHYPYKFGQLWASETNKRTNINNEQPIDKNNFTRKFDSARSGRSHSITVEKSRKKRGRASHTHRKSRPGLVYACSHCRSLTPLQYVRSQKERMVWGTDSWVFPHQLR